MSKEWVKYPDRKGGRVKPSVVDPDLNLVGSATIGIQAPADPDRKRICIHFY
jgi:hypothetical protein